MKYNFVPLLINIATGNQVQNSSAPCTSNFEKIRIGSHTTSMLWSEQVNNTSIPIGEVLTRTIFTDGRLLVVSQIALSNTVIANGTENAPSYSYNAQRSMSIVFDNIVTGCYHDKIKGGQAVNTDTIFKPYFDSSIYPLLIGLLPLQEGYRQNIAVYDFDPVASNAVNKATINDVQSAVLGTATAGLRNVWVVTVTGEANDEQECVHRYYFDKADRKLWRQETASGGKFFLLEAN